MELIKRTLEGEWSSAHKYLCSKVTVT